MWLLDCTQLGLQCAGSGNIQLRFFHEKDTPQYAILSHTWIKDSKEEVSFEEMMRGPDYSKQGCEKLVYCCLQAKRHGFNYCWIDTCCINKGSSAELSEAINSMFLWYKQAAVCFAYLPTVDPYSPHKWAQFEQSRWFTRGWTLQELIAPSKILFFGKDWKLIGSKRSLCKRISMITGIHENFILGSESIQNASIAARMSWAANRETTRTEDLAYCLLGIFGINMSLLYGERENAFVRLQEAIIEEFDDQSIFAWQSSEDNLFHGIIARSPRDFAHSANIYPSQNYFAGEPFTITNRGLQIKMPFIRNPVRGQFQGILGCVVHESDEEPCVIALMFTSEQGTLESHERLKRVSTDRLMKIPWSSIDHGALDWATVFISKTSRSPVPENRVAEYQNSFCISLDDSAISGRCQIQGFFPECSCEGSIDPSRGIWLNPLSKNSEQVVICVKQPYGSELFLAFGFKHRLNGAVDAKKFWFGKFSWEMNSAKMNHRLCEKYGNGAPVTYSERLEVVWEMLDEEEQPWKTIIDGDNIEHSGYKIKVNIQAETSLHYVYQSVRIVYLPNYESASDNTTGIGYTPLKAFSSELPLSRFTDYLRDEPIGINEIGLNHSFEVPRPVESMLPCAPNMGSAIMIDDSGSPNNNELELMPFSTGSTAGYFENTTNGSHQTGNVPKVEDLNPVLWVEEFLQSEKIDSDSNDDGNRESKKEMLSTPDASPELNRMPKVTVVDLMGYNTPNGIREKTTLISLRPRL